MDSEDFIICKKGTIPLIFSIPHGGSLDCKDIPKRSGGILGIDKGTIGLGRQFYKKIEELSQEKPSLLISNLRRSKIDLNRPEEEAYELGSYKAKEIYTIYHSKLNRVSVLELLDVPVLGKRLSRNC